MDITTLLHDDYLGNGLLDCLAATAVFPGMGWAFLLARPRAKPL